MTLHGFGYTDGLRFGISENLAHHDLRRHDSAGLRQAAVAIVIVDSDAVAHGHDPHRITIDEMNNIPGVTSADGVIDGSMEGTAGGPSFLLTRRATRMGRHAGQWALPGGRLDPGETLLDAAMRETYEEVGVHLTEADLVGQLDDYTTRSGYVMTPYVFWGGANPTVNPDPNEVFSLHRISLRELCRTDSPRFVNIPESDRPVVQLRLGRDLIHAPTGAVLLQFRLVGLEGQHGERVDHLEQPVFAWQ